MFKNFNKIKYNSGITLVELLVVMSIFILITTIAIFNYGKFDSSLSTQNLADDIALTIRKAQSYAIGVRGLGNEFNYKYGVHFTANPTPGSVFAGSNTSFVFFIDMNDPEANNQYDFINQCGIPDKYGNECLEILNITSADVIKEIYLNKTLVETSSAVDIFFQRPNLEPTFYNGNGQKLNNSSVTIEVANQDDLTGSKFITVYNNGQISVSNSFSLE